ncbi:hypothetical protein BS47DRAFT_1400431 [Hydnum rufescens UP504]|uniref:Uncharacterized protein n=1 Tax=Hydnum rufescens UP504 TaxID=1448309 RepID=A0A9P6AGL0_9AGAM|nr:hypothetical protein BS47DRAFT_1400431 [Hydnum rufescens UP504]
MIPQSFEERPKMLRDGLGQPTNANSHDKYGTKEDEVKGVHEDYESNDDSSKEDCKQDGEETGDAIDKGEDEIGISHRGVKTLQTKEGLMLWKAEREIEALREKWMSMLELIDVLEKANTDLREELQEWRAR